MRKTAKEIYQALSGEFVRKGIASNRFSELEELYTWASIGENAKSEYEEINELLERLKECEEALRFYADDAKWEAPTYPNYGRRLATIHDKDIAEVVAKTGHRWSVGGKRAREYFKKYEGLYDNK